MTRPCDVCGYQPKGIIDGIKHAGTHSIKDKLIAKKRPAIGYAIMVFFFMLVAFTGIWAIFFYELYPVLQTLQITKFASDFDPNQVLFFDALVTYFPFAVLFGGAFYVFNEGQKKRGPEDLA